VADHPIQKALVFQQLFLRFMLFAPLEQVFHLPHLEIAHKDLAVEQDYGEKDEGVDKRVLGNRSYPRVSENENYAEQRREREEQSRVTEGPDRYSLETGIFPQGEKCDPKHEREYRPLNDNGSQGEAVPDIRADDQSETVESQ
jgi:hypothetical protein